LQHGNILDMQNSNVIRQIGKLDLSEMRSKFDIEVLPMENAQEIASAQFTQEIFNGKQNMCNPSDKSIDEHHKKRKRMHDTVEYIANLF